MIRISIHALQAESDENLSQEHDEVTVDFNPRSPSGERRNEPLNYIKTQRISIHALQAESDGLQSSCRSDNHRFQSTLSKRRATYSYALNTAQAIISIHALQAESDAQVPFFDCLYDYFNPRSPSGERLNFRSKKQNNHNFNPRSPSGERRLVLSLL